MTGFGLVAPTPGQGLHRSRNPHPSRLGFKNEPELREPWPGVRATRRALSRLLKSDWPRSIDELDA